MARTGATQQFVQVEDVKNGVVYLKDGSLRAILMVNGINFDLKSETEQNTILHGFQEFLNGLDFSVQLFIHSRKLNIKPYLERKLGQAAALGYTSKPKRPQYVKLFLQWVLQEELSLSSEAASTRWQPILQILAVDDPGFLEADVRG